MLNVLQYEMAAHVSQRVFEDTRAIADDNVERVQPFRWKNINEDIFQHLLKLGIGVEFQNVILCAVMADILSGSTIQHALNIGICGNQKGLDWRRQSQPHGGLQTDLTMAFVVHR